MTSNPAARDILFFEAMGFFMKSVIAECLFANRPKEMLMPNPMLVLVAQAQSKVRFLSSDENSVDLRVLLEDESWVSHHTASTRDEEVELEPGTYVAVAEFPYLLGCQILEGLVTIIQPYGGEDPWPVPPKLSPADEEILRIEAEISAAEAGSPGEQEDGDLVSLAGGEADGGEDPFPVPPRKPPYAGAPLPLLKNALRAAIYYARELKPQ